MLLNFPNWLIVTPSGRKPPNFLTSLERLLLSISEALLTVDWTKTFGSIEYEFFVINVGAAAYKGSGSSVAKTTGSSDSQGTA